jgi:hypothetical protein
LKVELSEADMRAGLRLAPSSKEVTVVDAPVDGIKFVQYRAKVSGSVHCLGKFKQGSFVIRNMDE